MLHVCVQKFDVMENFEFFWKLNRASRVPASTLQLNTIKKRKLRQREQFTRWVYGRIFRFGELKTVRVTLDYLVARFLVF